MLSFEWRGTSGKRVPKSVLKEVLLYVNCSSIAFLLLDPVRMTKKTGEGELYIAQAAERWCEYVVVLKPQWLWLKLVIVWFNKTTCLGDFLEDKHSMRCCLYREIAVALKQLHSTQTLNSIVVGHWLYVLKCDESFHQAMLLLSSSSADNSGHHPHIYRSRRPL